MIQQLKTELVEAKNAARISEANIKVIEADLVKRLHDEVEQVSPIFDEKLGK